MWMLIELNLLKVTIYFGYENINGHNCLNVIPAFE